MLLLIVADGDLVHDRPTRDGTREEDEDKRVIGMRNSNRFCRVRVQEHFHRLIAYFSLEGTGTHEVFI